MSWMTDYSYWLGSRMDTKMLRECFFAGYEAGQKQERVNYSWEKYPDRSGGAFSQEEIDRAKEWR